MLRTLLLLALPLLAGCLQVDTTVRLEEDGSATITERLRFSRRLLEASRAETGAAKDAPNVARFLTKQATEERLKLMGKGVRLVAHVVNEAEGGARESVSTYKIDDITELRYGSPFLASANYDENNVVQVRMRPIFKSKYWGQAGDVRFYYPRAGELALSFKPLKPIPKPKPRADRQAKSPSPLENQALRELLPVMRDFLKGFEVRLSFECYASIRSAGFGYRGRTAHTRKMDLLHFTDRTLDRHGKPFVENEELMLNLLRWRLAAKNIVDHVSRFPTNRTLPVFLSWGSGHGGLRLTTSTYARHRAFKWKISDEIFFPPSRPLFDKHFKGKELDFTLRAKLPKEIANYDKIGYQPETGSANVTGHRLGP